MSLKSGLGRAVAVVCLTILTLLLSSSSNLIRANYMYCTIKSEDLFSRINDAEMELGEAFEAILDAEVAGANVSELVGRLNGAGALFAEVNMALRIDEIDDVDLKIDRCIEIARAVMDEALALKEAALIERKRFLWMNIALLFIGIAVFLTLLAFTWRGFKRYYIKKLLSMRPEVSSNADS